MKYWWIKMFAQFFFKDSLQTNFSNWEDVICWHLQLGSKLLFLSPFLKMIPWDTSFWTFLPFVTVALRHTKVMAGLCCLTSRTAHIMMTLHLSTSWRAMAFVHLKSRLLSLVVMFKGKKRSILLFSPTESYCSSHSKNPTDFKVARN